MAAPVYREVAAKLRQVPLPEGTALAATGSLARGEMTPYSDVDLLLIHDEQAALRARDVDKLWDAARDTGFRVDFAVRTPRENAGIVAADPKSALALLDVRLLHGRSDLVDSTRRKVLAAWRAGLMRYFDQVVEEAIARWRRSGAIVAMTRPDIKNGRGGLRDHELLMALALSQLVHVPDLSAERGLLLSVRAQLHRAARRHMDVLEPEFAEDIAPQLGFADRFALAHAIIAAGAKIQKELNGAMNLSQDVFHRRQRAVRPARRPLDVDVVEAGGEVHLARSARRDDPALPLRVAAASARATLPVAEATWDQLRGVAALPARWPRPVVEDFLAALSSPQLTRDNVTVLDQRGLWQRYVPQWPHIRGLMPRERTHIHTVDRHSLETVAGCAKLLLRVSRPDLLLIAGLYHDVGKREPRKRPHAIVGAEAVARFAATLGLPLRERSCLQTVVAEHALFAQIATTMDPASPAALARLLDATGHDLCIIELLAALVEADSRATGPGVWTRSLSYGRDVLLARARSSLARFHPVAPAVAAEHQMRLREKPDNRLVLSWRGPMAGLVRLVAACHHHAWLISSARCRSEGDEVLAELEVRSATQASLELAVIHQAFQSGQKFEIPRPGMGPAAVLWQGRYCDVRTRDRPGVLAALVALLPSFEWLDVRTVGASVIARVALRARPEPGERAAIGEQVSRVLGGM